MNYVLGVCFLLAGAGSAIWGDRTVQEKGGIVLKALSWSEPRASLLKIPIAAALAGVGVWFLFRGGA